MPALQQTYYDLLMDRVRADRYPSHQLLDRLETTLFTSEQVTGYIAVLLEKVAECHYPSHQLLDRIERMLLISSAVA